MKALYTSSEDQSQNGVYRVTKIGDQMRQIIVGFAGLKGAGKDTAAQALIRLGWHHDSFAAPIRQAACALLGLTMDELQTTKEQPRIEFDGKSLREFMQLMGTEFGRNMFGPDMWVRSLITRIRKYQRVVVTDVRFINEAAFIRGNGGMIIEIMRPGLKRSDAHVSEDRLPSTLVDVVLGNASAIDELHERVIEEVAVRYKDFAF